jgi:hypothetical protein
MRRTAAGIAVTLLAALAIGGPLAATSHAGPATLHCTSAATAPAACGLLDDLAAQLASVAPLLPEALAPLATSAQGFAARSEGPAGVPTAEVTSVSTALLEQLGQLPRTVQGLVGATKLGALTDTLQALVDELATVSGDQKAAETSKPTPATTSKATAASPRATEGSTFGGSASTGGSSSGTSSAGVPDVPVGDPLTLSPLRLPDFGFRQATEPVVVADLAPAVDAAAIPANAFDTLPENGRGTELAVVLLLSFLLMAGAGIAQAQQSRHTIPD